MDFLHQADMSLLVVTADWAESRNIFYTLLLTILGLILPPRRTAAASFTNCCQTTGKEENVGERIPSSYLHADAQALLI